MMIKESLKTFTSEHHHVNEFQHEATDLVLKNLGELCCVDVVIVEVTHIFMFQKVLELSFLAVKCRLSSHALLLREADKA